MSGPNYRSGRLRRVVGILVVSVALLATSCSSSSVAIDPGERSITLAVPPPTEAPTPTADPIPDPTAVPTPDTQATPTPQPVPTATPLATPTPTAAGDDEPIALDDAVLTGVLDNGLTYFVRENRAPGGSAQLRLVVKAGSLVEDDDQLGMAHFLEHMMFNGTEKYPANELIRVLEGFGAEFGPDINAYTSFEETVYSLAITLDDDQTLDSALDVLWEWSNNAVIDPDEVAKERGVVVEEWRLRDSGVDGRLLDLFIDVLMGGTRYAERVPIGTVESIETTDARRLTRFYDEWYRPDLMALVVVGDFDGPTVVDAVAAQFGQKEPNPDGRDPIEVSFEPNDEAVYRVMTDPDLSAASTEIFFPGPSIGAPTPSGERRDFVVTLAFEMVARRLSNDIDRGVLPLIAVVDSDAAFASSQSAPLISFDMSSAETATAVEAGLTELTRAARLGFGPAEFERTINEWQAFIDQELANEPTVQDSERADGLVDFFLGEAYPSAELRTSLLNGFLATITPEEVQRELAGILERPPSIVITAPAADADLVPTEGQLAEIAAEVAAAESVERDAEQAVGDQLIDRPDPVDVVERRELADTSATEIVLENGARVFLNRTGISQNKVVFRATSPGGLSALEPADAATYTTLTLQVANDSGLGEIDRVTLENFEASRVVSLRYFADLTTDQVFGSASTDDLEALFALIHLSMTAPRADDVAVRTHTERVRPVAEAPEDLPGLAGLVELGRVRYGDSPYFYFVPPLEAVDGYDPQAGLAAMQSRYDDASDFVFVFSGDFDAEVVEDLARRYIGTLPSTGGTRDDPVVDVQPDPPPGIQRSTVEAGTSEQGTITFLFTGSFEDNPRNRLLARVVGEVIAARMRDRIRERLGATYSPFAVAELIAEPDEIVETYIEISGDPEGLETISAEVIDEIEAIANGDFDPIYLDNVIAQLTDEFQFFSNEGWIDFITFYALNPDEGAGDIRRRSEVVRSFTIDDVAGLARTAIPVDEFIEIQEIPAGG